MNHGRILTNRINESQKTTIRLVHSDFVPNFTELLIKDKFVIIHQRNLQTLAYEMVKVKSTVEVKHKLTTTEFETISLWIRTVPSLESKMWVILIP